MSNVKEYEKVPTERNRLAIIATLAARTPAGKSLLMWGNATPHHTHVTHETATATGIAIRDGIRLISVEEGNGTMVLMRPTWPGDARCAVSLTFDNFGESFDLLRYGHAGGASADGVYAPRRGIARILDLLERHTVPATFFLEGWNVRKYGALAREIVARGHEVASHGWMHERWSELTPAVERDLIAKTTAAHSEILGRPPRGWRSPSGLTTVSTLALLHEAGYRYDSSFGDEDIPYWSGIGADRAEEILELPWSWPLDDAAFYAYPGTIRRPSEIAQLWMEEFDAALALTGSFTLVCHPRFSGRPARLLALERLIEHIEQQEGVWFARCEEIAQYAAEDSSTPHYPAPETMPTRDEGR